MSINFNSTSDSKIDADVRDNNPAILQIAHGKVIPEYASAYSLRCHTLINRLERKLISVGGSILKDERSGYSEQYRSLLLTGSAFIKGDRSLEIYISRKKYLRKKYIKRLMQLVESSQIIIFEGPWQYPIVKDALNGKFIVYDAHNVEYVLRKGNRFQEESKKIEGDLLERANIVLSVTKRDIKNFIEIYAVDENKLYYVPHEIRAEQGEWRGNDSNSIVFIGSAYAPNYAALKRIEEIAYRYKEFRFEIIGSVKPARGSKMKNIVYHGVIDDAKKNKIMNGCFLALNPVTEGSGRNLKMIDYLAHGLPIISTPIGTRGLEAFDITESIIVSDPDKFGDAIEKLSNDRDRVIKMSLKAKELYKKILESEKGEVPEEIILRMYNAMDGKLQKAD